MPEATWLSRPDDVNALVTQLWAENVSKVDGVLTDALGGGARGRTLVRVTADG